MGRSLSGKTVGIVGMGNIGRLTAEKFQVRVDPHGLGGVCEFELTGSR